MTKPDLFFLARGLHAAHGRVLARGRGRAPLQRAAADANGCHRPVQYRWGSSAAPEGSPGSIAPILSTYGFHVAQASAPPSRSCAPPYQAKISRTMAASAEPRRVCRRLRSLRGWSDGQRETDDIGAVFR